MLAAGRKRNREAMEQQVYDMNLDSYPSLQQTPDEQQHLQQKFQAHGIMLSGDEPSQEVVIQDEQSQHVLYSPMKQNEQQLCTTQDDSMQSQFLIQSPHQQQTQQVFCANISPQNQNRMQQQQNIALNHNMINSNQSQQKVS